MEIISNILLAVFGLGATLSAFGGETWRKGTERLFRRVTIRGWISLVCIVLAFSIGVYKEISNYDRNRRLQEQSELKQKRIDKQMGLIERLQNQIARSQRKLEESAEDVAAKTDQLGEQQLASIEAAFSLTVKIPRELDDCVVNLTGQREQAIPSRLGGRMLLYWGDTFDVSFVPPLDKSRKPSADELASLKLRAGKREYPLHDGLTERYFRKSIRIYGSSPKSMAAVILNPRGIKGIKLKIFVKSTDSTRGQKEFRRLILSSPFSVFAKKIYKRVTADMLRMREAPNGASRVLSQLPHGSFVRVLQISNEWSEILTPEGRQGWLASKHLGEIE